MTQLTLGVLEPIPKPDPADPAPGPTVSVLRTSVDRISNTLLRQMTPSEVIWQLIALRPHAVLNALLAIAQLPYATMLRTVSR